MVDDELVFFVPELEVRDAVERLFTRLESELLTLAPGADVQHVGSTAIPGSLTKGDLDIQVRVSAGTYAAAKQRLETLYRTNTGGFAAADGVSFEAEESGRSVGIHLTVVGGSVDIQHRFRDRLNGSAALRDEYDGIKRRFHGRSMERYRDEKALFVARVLAGPE